jgi:twitching motility protein PilT
MVAESLQAVVSQVLFKKRDGKGRVAAFEIMVSNPAVRNLIRENKIFQITSIMQTSKGIGMQTLESSVQDLLDRNVVSRDEVSFYVAKTQR